MAALLLASAGDAGTGSEEGGKHLEECAPIHVVSNLSDPDPELWKRYLAIIFDGLRPDGANPLPQPAPTLP